MAMPAQNVSRSTASDAASRNVLANPPSSNAVSKKPSRRGIEAATSPSDANAAKKLAAEQKKDERRRQAEVKKQDKAEKLRQKEIKQNETDDRFTPPELIRVIEDIFGSIEFDPCWHEMSAVRPKAYLDVRQGHNGLRDDWSGSLVFVNPPWSTQDKWVRRAYDQWLKRNAETVICLVPAKTDTVFFHQILVKYADLYFIEGRPRFFKKDGTAEGTKNSTMLVIFGATDQQKMRCAELVRGSWCQPSQRSSARTEERAPVSSVRPAEHCGLPSCAVPFAGNDANWTVFCNPSAGRGQTARRA